MQGKSVVKLLLTLCLAQAQNFANFYQTIPEGFVGVSFWLGQVQPELIRQPTFYNPLFSKIELIKYIEDTDEVPNVQCVSKEGNVALWC